jgi:hypothetical protein
MALSVLLLAVLVAPLTQDAPRADCREWHECRQMALDAGAAGDYERFHDLAWRAIQTGPKNDPALMLLLARAQSLSGRPHDALVMLQRLAAMGVPTDAATNEDFRRVRNLPGWADFAAGSPKASPSVSAAGPSKPAEPASSPTSATKPAAAAPLPSKSSPPAASSGADAVRFETLPFTPAGIAYDGVSRRFIVADRRARRLAVVDEFSHHVANLASAQSAGFGDIAAIEIDPRQGDLWVVSSDGSRATLHKLQLVSGRSLASYGWADRFGDVQPVDVAATADDGVLVLDRAGHRVFQLRPKETAPELVLTLPDDTPASIAPAANGVAYVAHARGISRVDLSARSVADVKAAKGLDLGNITKLRWHKGSLIGVQRHEGGYRAIRIGLDRSGRATSLEPLGASLSDIDPTAATISGDAFYYLAGADDKQMTVGKLPLK